MNVCWGFIMSTMSDQDVYDLPLATLFHLCQIETTHFQHHQPYDPRYGFELFRRAAEQNELAWECLYRQYMTLVTYWIETHPALPYCQEDVPYIVNRTFERFWQRWTPEMFARFSQLAQILRYLECCAVTCLLDINRRQKHRHELPLEQMSGQPDTLNGYADERHWPEQQRVALWQTLLPLVPDEKEQVVLLLSYLYEWKPKEIYSHYRHQFHSISQVYRIKQNLLHRLRHVPQVQAFAEYV